MHFLLLIINDRIAVVCSAEGLLCNVHPLIYYVSGSQIIRDCLGLFHNFFFLSLSRPRLYTTASATKKKFNNFQINLSVARIRPRQVGPEEAPEKRKREGTESGIHFVFCGARYLLPIAINFHPRNTLSLICKSL